MNIIPFQIKFIIKRGNLIKSNLNMDPYESESNE